jgi:hypothetical protein
MIFFRVLEIIHECGLNSEFGKYGERKERRRVLICQLFKARNRSSLVPLNLNFLGHLTSKFPMG